MNNDELPVEDIAQTFWDATTDLTTTGHKPLAVAGVMMVQALTIYKTLLSPDEFDAILDHVSETRDKVKTIDLAGGTLQ